MGGLRADLSRWSGMVALFRAVVGVGLVSGLLVVLLWSEQQVGPKTPVHTPGFVVLRDADEGPVLAPEVVEEEEFVAVTERLGALVGGTSGVNATPTSHTPTRASQNKPAAPDKPEKNVKWLKKKDKDGTKQSEEKRWKEPAFTIDKPSTAPHPHPPPKIYVITPTYRRPEQVAELTRLAQTLMLVPNLHWLVAEDAPAPTKQVLAFLDSCSVPHTYLLGRSSRKFRGASKPRGVSNRNAGLRWLKSHAKEGILYFADDDNTYDYKIFQEMRSTRQVSMFPVGLVTRLGVSSPVVADGKVVGFYDGWIAGRRFPVDMAGFAVNIKFYLERGAPLMPYSVGFEEDGFLKSLRLSPDDINPLADNCTKIMVWHTRTVKSLPAVRMPETERVLKTNLKHLRTQMVFQAYGGVS